jgi:hypothetical protein
MMEWLPVNFPGGHVCFRPTRCWNEEILPVYVASCGHVCWFRSTRCWNAEVDPLFHDQDKFNSCWNDISDALIDMLMLRMIIQKHLNKGQGLFFFATFITRNNKTMANHMKLFCALYPILKMPKQLCFCYCIFLSTGTLPYNWVHKRAHSGI